MMHEPAASGCAQAPAWQASVVHEMPSLLHAVPLAFGEKALVESAGVHAAHSLVGSAWPAA
jgi:hypothetical protein